MAFYTYTDAFPHDLCTELVHMDICIREFTQCLFGEHLLSLSANRDKVVSVVESEKTAIICSVQYPDCIWLATGGKSQLSIDKMRVLANRTVIFFPDVDGYREWTECTRAFSFCRSIKVSDVLEQNVAEADRLAKIDMGGLGSP